MSKLIRERFVKTRKSHECCCCGVIFPSETEMYVQTGIDDGILNAYICEPCREIIYFYSEKFVKDENQYPELCIKKYIEENFQGKITPQELLKNFENGIWESKDENNKL